MSGFFCAPNTLHPYECDGPGKCQHCDRLKLDDHDPETCDLCDPEYAPQPLVDRDPGDEDHV